MNAKHDEMARETRGQRRAAPTNVALDPSLACFILLAKFHGVPADARQISHERGKGDDSYSLDDLALIAKKLNLMARLRNIATHEMRKLPLPILIDCVDGNAVALLKIEDSITNPRYLIQRGDTQRPEIWTNEQLEERYAGRVLLLTSRETMTGDKRPFDISWFIPALVKYVPRQHQWHRFDVVI